MAPARRTPPFKAPKMPAPGSAGWLGRRAANIQAVIANRTAATEAYQSGRASPAARRVIPGYSTPNLATHFVSLNGSDSNDGSRTAPWLTISKAITTVPSGSVVSIAPGTYVENTSSTGRLQITRIFTGPTVFQSSTGIASDVVITGASDATINTILQSNAAWLEFRNVTFGMRVNTNGHALRLANANNIVFAGCVFTVKTNSGQVNAAVNVQPSGAGTDSPITFNNCTFNASGTDNARGVAVVWTANNVIGVTFNACTSNMTGDSLYFNGGTVAVNGGTWVSAANHVLLFGADSHTGGNACTATVVGATITATAGHGLIFGNGCTGSLAQGCTIDGGDYSVVLKEHTGTTVRNCTIAGASTGEVYFKAAVGCTVTQNTITTSGTQAILLGVGDTGNKCGTDTLTYNRITVNGTAKTFTWGDGTADTGGGVVNNNTYVMAGSGNLGAVRADASVANITELRAAWGDYDVTTNDNASVVG